MVTESRSNQSITNNQKLEKSPLIKGQEKALEFFACLEFATISKLSVDPTPKVKQQNGSILNDDQKTMELELVIQKTGNRINGVNLSGTWQLERNENIEEFLKSQGYGFAKRKISSIASITLKITHNDNALRVETITSFKSWTLDMSIGGGNHDTEDPVSGDKVQFTVNWKDD